MKTQYNWTCTDCDGTFVEADVIDGRCLWCKQHDAQRMLTYPDPIGPLPAVGMVRCPECLRTVTRWHPFTAEIFGRSYPTIRCSNCLAWDTFSKGLK